MRSPSIQGVASRVQHHTGIGRWARSASGLGRPRPTVQESPLFPVRRRRQTGRSGPLSVNMRPCRTFRLSAKTQILGLPELTGDLVSKLAVGRVSEPAYKIVRRSITIQSGAVRSITPGVVPVLAPHFGNPALVGDAKHAHNLLHDEHQQNPRRSSRLSAPDAFSEG
jgi:hypothetical protein